MFTKYNDDDEDLKPEFPSENLEVPSFLQNYIRLHFDPVADPRLATLNKTTSEIFDALQGIFPSGMYFEEHIASWMKDAGFTFYNFGEMKYEWLLKDCSS